MVFADCPGKDTSAGSSSTMPSSAARGAGTGLLAGGGSVRLRSAAESTTACQVPVVQNTSPRCSGAKPIDRSVAHTSPGSESEPIPGISRNSMYVMPADSVSLTNATAVTTSFFLTARLYPPYSLPTAAGAVESCASACSCSPGLRNPMCVTSPAAALATACETSSSRFNLRPPPHQGSPLAWARTGRSQSSPSWRPLRWPLRNRLTFP